MRYFFVLLLILFSTQNANAANTIESFGLDKYALYLKSSFEQLKYTEPAAAVKIREQLQIPSSDIYYYPQNFYEPLLEADGVLPVMLFNARYLAHSITDEELLEKFAHLQKLKDKYNELRANPDSYGPRYEAWTRSDPIFRTFSEEQLRALYVLKLYGKKYIQFKLNASLLNMVSDVSAIQKTTGDCDTISYLYTDLLLQARGTDGQKLFAANMFGFDLLKILFTDMTNMNHVRMRLKTPAGDVIVEATTGHVSGVNGANDYKFDKKVRDMRYERSFSMPEALGYNLYGEQIVGDKIFNNITLAFVRSIYLISDGNDLLEKNFATQREYQKNTAYNVVIEQLNELVEIHNNDKPFNEALYDKTFADIHELAKKFGDDRLDVRQGYYGTLQQLNPNRYERLSKELNNPAATENTGAGV